MVALLSAHPRPPQNHRPRGRRAREQAVVKTRQVQYLGSDSPSLGHVERKLVGRTYRSSPPVAWPYARSYSFDPAPFRMTKTLASLNSKSAMSPWALRLADKYYPNESHPYRLFERRVLELLRPDQVLVDAGCGRSAPVLQRFRGKARELVGIDLVPFDSSVSGLNLIHGDLVRTGLPDESVDVIMSRSVMEHITDPPATYSEMNRILRPGGHFIFLTANMWDYASLISKLIPNRFHSKIVAITEGREEKDVFPVAYRTNTRRAIARFASQTDFEVLSLDYLGQYPNYFLFNGLLFLIATGYEKLVDRIRPLHFLKGWILATLRKRA